MNSQSVKAFNRKNILWMAPVFGAQVAFILLTFPYLNKMSFIILYLAPLIGGWLLGRWGGAAAGVLSTTIIIFLQGILEPSSECSSVQTVFGVALSTLTGTGVGILREITLRSQLAIQKQQTAEENQQNLEKQLQQAQKMEAIGTLAGGVAHDMNNILGIIMSSASVLKHTLQIDEACESDLDNILTACRRGRDLTRNLLGFARKGTYIRKALDLNRIVHSATSLLKPVVNKNICITTTLADDLYPVHGDGSQIEQAILNICINAVEAIEMAETKGSISISTRNSTAADTRLLDANGLETGSYSIIEITDDGPGIEETVLRHVFEPFFTTKNPGQGTGLGLSMAYGAMKNHGGSIDIESLPDRGTCLRILLPAYSRRKRTTDKQHTVASIKRNGRILLVDDEPLIRNSNQRMLQQLGYDVILAESGERAIELYRAPANEFDLVILDFIMPGMDGAETFHRLRQIDKGVKVLISSGYSKDGNIEILLKSGALGFVQKPFDINQLDEVLNLVPES